MIDFMLNLISSCLKMGGVPPINIKPFKSLACIHFIFSRLAQFLILWQFLWQLELSLWRQME
jgi:hypothetical protein